MIYDTFMNAVTVVHDQLNRPLFRCPPSDFRCFPQRHPGGDFDLGACRCSEGLEGYDAVNEASLTAGFMGVKACSSPGCARERLLPRPKRLEDEIEEEEAKLLKVWCRSCKLYVALDQQHQSKYRKYNTSALCGFLSCGGVWCIATISNSVWFAPMII